MNPRIFITASFEGIENKAEVEKLCAIIKAGGFEDFCFIRDVEHYEKVFNNPHDLMQRAKEEIEKSDYLLIDMTDKPTGRAFEAGMAYGFGKKIIVIMKTGTQIKDTTRGIADHIIEYEKIESITTELEKINK